MEDFKTLQLGLRSFPALKRLTVSSAVWRKGSLFPKYETPFFRSLPPGFEMPLHWPWMGGCLTKCSEEQRKKLALPWEESHEEWRGYRIAVESLLATAAHHNVVEFVIDTNHGPTGISHQLFTTYENTGYISTLKLFERFPLTTLELSLNMLTAEDTGFPCFHNGLIKRALCQSFASSISLWAQTWTALLKMTSIVPRRLSFISTKSYPSTC
jgi:hypothetical protein